MPASPATTAAGDQSTPSTVLPNTTTSMPSSPLDDESRAYMADIKETLVASNAIAAELEASQASEDDPRVAIIYGLRARGQAINALKAMHESQTPLADDSYAEMLKLLNRARLVEEGEEAAVLAQARSLLEGVAPPSVGDTETPEVLREVAGILAALIP